MMFNPLELNGSTKLADILSTYPWMKEELPHVNEKFKLLNSPLGKIMTKTATISEMSKRSGLVEDVLIEKLESLISSRA